MDPFCLMFLVPVSADDEIIGGTHSFIPVEHGLNTVEYLTTVVDHVHPFMAVQPVPYQPLKPETQKTEESQVS